MKDLAEYVLLNLLKIAIGVTAKGGKLFDEIDQQREAEGKSKVRRDNAADQLELRAEILIFHRRNQLGENPVFA